MDRAKIVDFYLQKLENKDFEIYQVREELVKNNIDEDEIKIIVKLVDNELQQRLRANAVGESSNELVWIGSILTAVGAGVTIATYTGAIDMGNSFLLTYGPFLGGLSILFGGIAKKKMS
ncbi:MAG TPA: hypothetical protein VFW11_02875 [Cyclobacteriaceae bacterium]|nr:hypothetical protein [Cyclobacteriaceae bacterium]